MKTNFMAVTTIKNSLLLPQPRDHLWSIAQFIIWMVLSPILRRWTIIRVYLTNFWRLQGIIRCKQIFQSDINLPIKNIMINFQDSNWVDKCDISKERERESVSQTLHPWEETRLEKGLGPLTSKLLIYQNTRSWFISSFLVLHDYDYKSYLCLVGITCCGSVISVAFHIYLTTSCYSGVYPVNRIGIARLFVS